MEALTVWQPWAWAIGAGLKLVENRDWTPPWRRLKPGDDLVIHAASRAPSREDMYALRVAARAAGHRDLPDMSANVFSVQHGQGRVVAVATFEGIAHSREEVPEAQRAWWVGSKGWLLSNMRQLNLGTSPAVRGQQGLWVLPGDVERLVRQQLAQPAGDLWRKTA
jgi:ASCH domain